MALLVDADLAPSNNGAWATHTDTYGKGGFRTVADNTARDAITTARRVAGMLVYSVAALTFYQLGAGLTNADWVAVTLGGSTVVDFKDSVRLGTAAAMAASTRVGNVRTANANGVMANIDGVTPVVGNRILDKDNVTGADRGIWTVTSVGSAGTPWVLTRAGDADTSADVTSGMAAVVEEGTTNAGKLFLLTTANPIVLNTTALTFAALSGGVTAGNGLTGISTISVLAENATIAVGASGIKRAAITGDVTVADGSNTSVIANDAVTYTKLQNVSAASRLLGRGSASGSGDAEELTPTGGLAVSGTNLQLSAVLLALATAGTALQLPRMNAGATAAEWFTPASFRQGTNLADANTTVTRAGGALYVMLAGVATAARDVTAGTSALNSVATGHVGFAFQFQINAQAHAISVKNGGPLADTLHIVPAGEKHVIDVEWDGVNFFRGAWTDLT